MWKRIVNHLNSPSRNAYTEIHHPGRWIRYLMASNAGLTVYISLSDAELEFNQPADTFRKTFDKSMLVFTSTVCGYAFPYVSLGFCIFNNYNDYIKKIVRSGEKEIFDKHPNAISFTYNNGLKIYKHYRHSQLCLCEKCKPVENKEENKE